MNLTKLDNIFSLFIRQRDCPDGIGECISCGKIITPKTCDAGHYINRKHLSTRFSEINVNAQCRECNRFDEGNAVGYHFGLELKYGEGTVKKLLAAKMQTVKFSQFEIDAMAKHYKKLVNEK